MIGFIVLNTEEKSTNNILANVPPFSKYWCMVFKRKSFASSTPLLVWYANCKESNLWPVTVISCDLTSLFKAFMAKEVNAMGRKSFKECDFSCLGIGIILDVFHKQGTTAWSRDAWNREWNTTLSCSAQYLSVLPQIPSGPGALLTGVAFSCFITLKGCKFKELEGLNFCLKSSKTALVSCFSKRVKN